MSELLKILHLEDNENDAELVQMELEKEKIDFEYKRVDNEPDFVQSLLHGKYNLIISDFSLPRYNGLLALERAVTIQPETPFILVSGTLGEDAAVESMKKGATDYVLKNRLNKLVPTIIRAIEEVKEKKRRHTAEERFGKLIESARDVIYTLSSEGKLTSLNKAFENITGLNRNDWIGRGFSGLVHPDDLNIAVERFNWTLGGKVTESYEIRFLNSEGNYLIGEVLTTPLIHSSLEIEIIGVVRDITERKKSEEIIKSSLKEKEVLLKEIHHRVKNNLQIITSLLKMQTSEVSDPRMVEIFKDIQNRVMAMSYIHQSFYQSTNLSDIDLNSYVSKLVGNLYRAYGVDPGKIKLKIETSGLKIGIDTAIPCGLILNEIVSNSLKYAFKPLNEGEIAISISEIGKNFMLIVRDNGKGIGENIDIESPLSLGMVLIKMLTEQIDGTVMLNKSSGTEYTILFPNDRYKNRLNEVEL